MDVVYILGDGSLADNREILYSIRLLARYMIDLRSIYVVGEDVPFLPHVIHVLVEDKYSMPWQNALHKVRAACKIEDLSDEFLLMNDDFFMIAPFEGADFPFYAIKNADGGNSGRFSYQVHCPIRIKKDWYEKMPLSVEQVGQFSPRSFYANFYQAPPTPITDFILRHGEDVPDFETQIVGRDFFSISNSTMIDSDFEQWLHSLAPTPSRFEF